MDYGLYLKEFQKSVSKLDKNKLDSTQLEVSISTILNCVCLKLYKRKWTNDYEDPMNAKTRIFFSVWISDKAIQEEKIFYNIHAFKLRQLNGYSISSRAFADNFRKHFKPFQSDWENVSVNFGPLTLMEGWKAFDIENPENIIAGLANNFINISYLIDDALKAFEHIQE